MKLPKMFFGWTNLKWLIREFFAMYSTKDSYFSKKRFESSVAFMGAMGLILAHAYYTRVTITNSEILADAALLFAIAGYTVSHIQKEKKPITPNDSSKEIPKDAPIKDDSDAV